MNKARFVFVGNRRFVLDEMLAMGCDIASVFVVGGSHLDRDIQADSERYDALNVIRVSSKDQLLHAIANIGFDVLISNGCPYIIPVDDKERKYVNIHPSFLPDLRGVDPAIGAVLFGRDGGATCHLMDKGIDTGPIISQIKIPYSEDLDVKLLYQLSFIAEKKCFSQALALGFLAQFPQKCNGNEISYKRTIDDSYISFRESNLDLIRKIKAFSNFRSGCFFKIKEKKYKVYSGEIVYNEFALEVSHEFDDGVIFLKLENDILFKKDNALIRFNNVISDDGFSPIVGDRLY